VIIEDVMPFIQEALHLNIPPTQKYSKVRNEGFFCNFSSCVVMKYVIQRYYSDGILTTHITTSDTPNLFFCTRVLKTCQVSGLLSNFDLYTTDICTD